MPESESTASLVFAVTVGTSAGAALFDEIPYGLECLRLLREVCDRTGVRLHAWCLMPDHACLLLGAARRDAMAASVTAWKSLCAQARGPRKGGAPLWQRGFSDQAIGSPEAVVLAARYIVGKPVRAGLVASSADYPLCGSAGAIA